jgi:hypothetical protein
MILLYIDESGSIDDPTDHFVVGGVAVHESDARQLNRIMDRIVTRNLDPHLHSLELHAQHIRAGKGPWGRIPTPIKNQILSEVPRTLGRFAGSHGYGLFAVARAPQAVPTADPFERTFEELLLRFNSFLRRHDGPSGEGLGLVVADEAKYESTLQPLVQRWRNAGTRFTSLTRLVEVPLFVDSKVTRLTQAADFVAHGVYRHYRASDSSLLTPMLPAFDTDGAVLHGLVHLVRDYRRCSCPACVSRQVVSRLH